MVSYQITVMGKVNMIQYLHCKYVRHFYDRSVIIHTTFVIWATMKCALYDRSVVKQTRLKTVQSPRRWENWHDLYMTCTWLEHDLNIQKITIKTPQAKVERVRASEMFVFQIVNLCDQWKIYIFFCIIDLIACLHAIF